MLSFQSPEVILRSKSFKPKQTWSKKIAVLVGKLGAKVEGRKRVRKRGKRAVAVKKVVVIVGIVEEVVVVIVAVGGGVVVVSVEKAAAV